MDPWKGGSGCSGMFVVFLVPLPTVRDFFYQVLLAYDPSRKEIKKSKLSCLKARKIIHSDEAQQENNRPTATKTGLHSSTSQQSDLVSFLRVKTSIPTVETT